MTIALRAAHATVSGAIRALVCGGAIAEVAARRLVPLQKFLTRKIDEAAR